MGMGRELEMQGLADCAGDIDNDPDYWRSHDWAGRRVNIKTGPRVFSSYDFLTAHQEAKLREMPLQVVYKIRRDRRRAAEESYFGRTPDTSFKIEKVRAPSDLIGREFTIKVNRDGRISEFGPKQPDMVCEGHVVDFKLAHQIGDGYAQMERIRQRAAQQQETTMKRELFQSQTKAQVVAEAKAAAKRAEELERKLQASVELFQCEIAGAQHTAGAAKLLAALEVGDELDLVHEKSNKHDSTAVRVEYEGVKLGYLPAKTGNYENKQALKFLEKDCDVFAVILSKNDRADHIRAYVNVGVYLRVAN
jgi:hypothetical protein